MSESSTSSTIHNFDLTSFKKAQTAMVAANDNPRNRYGLSQSAQSKSYTLEQVARIIDSGSLLEQKRLSRNYFNRNGYYQQLILYYTTLLKYTGMLIPNPALGKNLSTSHIQKRYFQAMEYVDKLGLETIFAEWAQKVLIDACFYGIVTKSDKNHLSDLSLP